MAWLHPLKDGKARVSFGELARLYDLSEETIKNAIREAFRERLVELRRREAPPLPTTRAEALETEIQRRYHLDVARVIDVGTMQQAGVAEEALWSDMVHRELGHAAAEVIAAGLLRQGDCVGLGSGRAVYFTVSGLQDHSFLSVQNVTLMSLTGALFPQLFPSADVGGAGVGLDADFHVALMGTRFAEPVTCLNVAYPIACASEQKQQEIRRNTILDEERYKRLTPTLAIVGVGVLEGRHRFANLADDVPRRMLEPILDPLQKLAEYVELYRGKHPAWAPIADIANWLFINPEPKGVVVPAPAKEKMRTLIGEVNKRLVTAREDQLSKAERIMLVAGTERKAMAVRYLLESESLHVKLLCTDTVVARVILGL